MLPGRMKDRVRIERRAVAQGPHGTQETWETVGSHYGRVSLVSVDGRAKYGQVGHTDVSHRVTLRGHVTLSLADHRLNWLGRGVLLQPLEPPAHTGDRAPYTTMVCKEYEEPHVEPPDGDDDGNGNGGGGGPFG